MPQMAPIALTDNQAATHNYVPKDIVSGVATLIESTGVPIGERRLSIAVSQTQTGRRKVTMKLVLPVVQDGTVGGISRPTVVRTAYADLTFTFDGSSSTAERNDTLALVASLLDASMAKNVVGDLQALY